jgi:RNA polymerase sigma-70 factor (ECF subfamily)
MENDETRLAEEEARVRRASQGDRDAVLELYEHYLDALYGYFRKRVGNKPEAETLTSETFTRAIERLLHGQYTWRGKSFGFWLFGIAKKVLQERRRELKNESATEELDNLIGRNEPLNEEEDVLDTIVQQEERDALWQLVHELPDAEQRILVLRHAQGLTYAEIAKYLKRSENACKQLHYRALTNLRRKVHESGLWSEAKEG